MWFTNQYPTPTYTLVTSGAHTKEPIKHHPAILEQKEEETQLRNQLFTHLLQYNHIPENNIQTQQAFHSYFTEELNHQLKQENTAWKARDILINILYTHSDLRLQHREIFFDNYLRRIERQISKFCKKYYPNLITIVENNSEHLTAEELLFIASTTESSGQETTSEEENTARIFEQKDILILDKIIADSNTKASYQTPNPDNESSTPTAQNTQPEDIFQTPSSPLARFNQEKVIDLTELERFEKPLEFLTKPEADPTLQIETEGHLSERSE